MQKLLPVCYVYYGIGSFCFCVAVFLGFGLKDVHVEQRKVEENFSKSKRQNEVDQDEINISSLQPKPIKAEMIDEDKKPIFHRSSNSSGSSSAQIDLPFVNNEGRQEGWTEAELTRSSKCKRIFKEYHT